MPRWDPCLARLRLTNGPRRTLGIVNGRHFSLLDGATLNLVAADLPDGGFSFFYCVNRSFVVDNVRIEGSLAASTPTVDVSAIRKALEERRAQYDEKRKTLFVTTGDKRDWGSQYWVWTTEMLYFPLLAADAHHARGHQTRKHAPLKSMKTNRALCWFGNT